MKSWKSTRESLSCYYPIISILYEYNVLLTIQIADFLLDEEDLKILSNLDQGEKGRLLLFQDHFPG